MELVVGQTYTREELNEILGVSPDCDCRIVESGHVCPVEGEINMPFMSAYDKAHVEQILKGDGDWTGAKLLRLIASSDVPHREAFRKGFPDYVEAYERWYYKDSYETYVQGRTS